MANDVVYKLSDVRKHDSEDDCWLVIEGVVYDVTDFLPEHPGGGEIVVDVAGSDATDEFDEIGHSKAAIRMLKDYRIGVLESAVEAPSGAADLAATNGSEPKKVTTAAAKAQGANVFIKVMQILLPVIILAAALLVRKITS